MSAAPTDPTNTDGDSTAPVEVLRRQATSLIEDLRELADPQTAAAKRDPLGLGDALGEAARALAGNPLAVLRVGFGFGTDSARAVAAAAQRAVGSTANGPASLPEKDKRYSDPAWERNAWYYLARQEHHLLADRLQELSAAAKVSDVARRKLDFLVNQTIESLAPSNTIWTNPAWPKKIVETGGLNIVRGARNMLRDVVQNNGMPRQTTPGDFVVGKDLGVTPGHVVYRNRLIEIIQYEPQTEKVHEIPLLMSPPWINKYYIMDLAPEKSLVEWAVQHGHTVFMISYRNPDSSLRDVTFADYMQEGPLTALDVIQDITGAEKVNVAALCLGGTLAAAMTAWMNARGDQRISSLTLMNTLLDFSTPGQLGVFTDEKTVDRMELSMRKDGYLPETSMKTTFDLLRSTDLVWNYVVNDWMLGEDPHAVRHADLERRLDPDAGRDAGRVPAEPLPGEPVRRGQAGARRGAGGRRRRPSGHVRHHGRVGPHRAVEGCLQGSVEDRWDGPVRALELRPHRRCGEPAVAEVEALVRRVGGSAGEPGRLARRRRRAQGLLVGGLGAVDRRARRQAGRTAEEDR